ncbi:hypothetical protein BC833DRAFT_594759 [Globomyces pollinis-pini]|nr:hypothetical protein BC833DRAFT_594759 [Globomyces pollinis-pini]
MMEVESDWSERWSHTYRYLETSGPFAVDGFEPFDSDMKSFFHDLKICVIGAGGLGCELLKNLAMTGYKDIHVLDMDTIDVSNLNRQFLFRQADVGHSKAEVAARFIMNRVPGCIVTPYFGKIQDKDDDFYSQFSIIVCGLDSVEARRWINAKVLELYDPEDPSTMIPIVDGGTEGFKGQARVIIPRSTACYECSLEMQTKPKTFPVCTIANTPRLPEHCIQWASTIQWPITFPDRKLDGDNPDDINWCMNTAIERGTPFNITGINFSLTQGVVKNIIPAIASTNAIVAAACANEVYKLTTNCAKYMNNYMMFMGDQGVYTYTFALEKKEACPVCGSSSITLKIPRESTLQNLIDILLDKPEIQMKKPSLRTGTTTLYMQAPMALELQTRPNLTKKIVDLIHVGEEINVSDAQLPINLKLQIQFI